MSYDLAIACSIAHIRSLGVLSPSLSSYGSVYKALDKRDGKLVAIKVLEVENEDTIELQKEINILRECDCEWIVRYKGSYRKDGNIWIVMEVSVAAVQAAQQSVSPALFLARDRNHGLTLLLACLVLPSPVLRCRLPV